MSAWGTGIFQDDVACEVRDRFKELLAAGETPDAASEAVLAEYDERWDSEEVGTTVWLALAAAQWQLGRVVPAVRDRAIEIIDAGLDLDLWDASDQKRRQTTLAKLAVQLRSEPPTTRLARVQRIYSIPWQPGDLVRYQRRSGSRVVLRVHGLWPNNREETSFDPYCDVLDWTGTHMPDSTALRTLRPRSPLPTAPLSLSQVFLLSPSGGRNFPQDRLEVVDRDESFPRARWGLGIVRWPDLDEVLAKGFGLAE